jgi:hypothetical protein
MNLSSLALRGVQALNGCRYLHASRHGCIENWTIDMCIEIFNRWLQYNIMFSFFWIIIEELWERVSDHY